MTGNPQTATIGIGAISPGAISIGEELKLAKPFMPEIAWPSIAMAVILPIIQGMLVWLAVTGKVTYWLVTPALGYLAFAWYTLIHDSIHGSIIRGRKYAWVHTLIGWVGSLNLFYTWPILRRTHQRHHSHTNSHQDPDHDLVAGSFLRLLGKMATASLMYMVPYFILTRIGEPLYNAKEVLNQRELREHVIVMHLLQAFVLGMFIAGFGMQVVLLFVIPGFIGGLLLMIFFQWLPHIPFETTGRYENTRIYRFPFADQLLFNQNIHLVHHLWPSVPFHLYAKMFKANRSFLESKGAVVEGLLRANNPAEPAR